MASIQHFLSERFCSRGLCVILVYFNTRFAWRKKRNNNEFNCRGVIAQNSESPGIFATDIIHFKRCLLFENRSVTKQFVVSHKVDKFKLCAHIRLARSPSRLYAVCTRSVNCVFVSHVHGMCIHADGVCVFLYTTITPVLCLYRIRNSIWINVWLRPDLFSM